MLEIKNVGTRLKKLFSEDEFLSRAVNVPVQRLQWDLAKQKGVDVWVRRDDLIDSHLTGNKFYKLFYNLQHAESRGYHQILSFGGAYSNHLYALAAAGRDFGFKTIGVIRGERPKELSPTLQDAERWGMSLHFVSRAEYNQKTLPELTESLMKCYGDFYTIPEGGANTFGIQGARVMGWALDKQLNADYTEVCVACGTGSTLAGIATGVSAVSNVIGFSVLKGEGDLGAQIVRQHQTLGLSLNNWRLISGYHAGGYGKKLPTNVHLFNKLFSQETALLLDPVYTLKMCWGVAQLLAQNYWPSGSRIVLIHTGGLQGRRGFTVNL